MSTTEMSEKSCLHWDCLFDVFRMKLLGRFIAALLRSFSQSDDRVQRHDVVNRIQWLRQEQRRQLADCISHVGARILQA